MSAPATARKVLHIGKYFHPHVGGMETYLHDLLRALARLNITPSALVHQTKMSITSVEESFSANGSALSVVRVATWCRLLFTPISPGFPWVLHRLIRRDEPDVLHLHLPNPSAFWALALPSARRLPWVVHWQSDVLTQRSHWLLKLTYRLYSPIESAMLKKVDKIIVSSPTYLATSQPLAKVAEKCVVIPLGIDDRFGDQTQINPALVPFSEGESSTTRDGNLNVLAIGRMTHYKGFDILLQAISQAEGVTLDLVGHGELARSLERLTDSLNLSTRVRFHGLLDDNARDVLLSRCDCLCLPSTDRTESFGMVLLEAMSAAKACVVSDVEGSGMSWLVENGETGLVTPVNDVDGLTHALCQLRDEPNLATRLGLQGRQKFLTALNIETSAKAIRDVYHCLLSPR